jgi:cyclopropane fatty-acyl-phospholipid synthase-like methyltransferase
LIRLEWPVPPESGVKVMDRERFESIYQGQAPWDIPGPQPAFVQLEEAGEIRGSVLDVGCGTGEHALYLASRGHEVWGVDFVALAIERAKEKAKQRRLNAHFLMGDALALEALGRTFDTVIDCGMFHTLTDEERAVFVKSLASVLRSGGEYHMACFSDREPPGEGPRRVSEQEIGDAFAHGWTVQALRESQFEVVDSPQTQQFSPGGPKAWVATIARK